MSVFDNIGSAKVSGGGVYFLPGQYRVRVSRAFLMTSRKGTPLVVVECDILESDNEERAVGTRASWVVNMSQDAALGNIKAFVAAANGIDPSNEGEVNKLVTKDVAEIAFSDENPLEGMELRLQCSNTKTRSGTDFTKHYWMPG